MKRKDSNEKTSERSHCRKEKSLFKRVLENLISYIPEKKAFGERSSVSLPLEKGRDNRLATATIDDNDSVFNNDNRKQIGPKEIQYEKLEVLNDTSPKNFKSRHKFNIFKNLKKGNEKVKTTKNNFKELKIQKHPRIKIN